MTERLESRDLPRRATALETRRRLRAEPRLDRWARRVVLSRLGALAFGRLTIRWGDERETFGPGQDPDLTAAIHVHDPAFFRRLVFAGGLGAAESFMEGEWETDDLTAVVRLFVRNRPVLVGLDDGWGRLAKPLLRLAHRRRANTRSGSQRNIMEHYDLGNEFFRLFLDEPTMTYSSAIFDRPDASLEEAAVTKLERICAKLGLGADDHVLEIGTGWGGFALHAARTTGCRVTTTTISREQAQLARQRVAEAGLTDQVEILTQDYRDLEGQYDKLVSIEMIEAVGASFLDTFFRVASERLKPDGLMCLQAITMADRNYQRALDNVDFIQRYIFPGSFIPSVSALTEAMARATDLVLVHLEDIGPHYAQTLRHWRERFTASEDAVRAQGYSPRFVRMWRYYLSYCEGGFLERAISDVQMVFAKPDARPRSLLGTL